MLHFFSLVKPKSGRLLLLLVGLLATLTAAATVPTLPHANGKLAAVQAPVFTTPANGSTITTNVPVYRGTGVPGATIRIDINRTAVDGSTVVDANGNWQFPHPSRSALPVGTYSVYAVARVGQTESFASNTITFTVAGVPSLTSASPTSAPEGDVFSLTGVNLQGVTSIKFEKNPNNPGDVTATSGFTISSDGTRITGIVVPVGARNGNLTVSTATTTSNPIFFDAYIRNTVVSLTRKTPTAASTNATSVAFQLRLFTGQIPSLSPSNFTLVTSAGITGASITSVTGGYDTPFTINVTTGTGEGTISLQVTSNDPAATRKISNLPYTAGEVYTIDRTAPTAAAVLTTPANGTTTSGQPVYSGTAEALSRVTVLVDGTSVGTALATAAGDWTLTQPTPLTAGSHTVSTTVQDQAGNAGPAGAAATFTVNPTPTLLPLTPSSAPIGGTIALSGTNLTGVTTITFEKSPNVSTYPTVTSGFVINAAGTQITGIVVPVGAKSGDLTVTSPNGTSSPRFFALIQDLVITGNQTVPPGSYNSITIGSGSTATLSTNVTVTFSLTVANGGTLNTASYVIGGMGSFTLAAGGTLSTANAGGISASGATGAIQTTGTRSFASDASYTYTGGGTMATGSGLPSQVRNLTISNFSPVTLSAPVSVSQVVTIGSSGNLLLNGNALTLLSSSTGTAMVVNSGSGSVSGNTAVVQRFIDPSLNSGLGYRHYSSPVAAATFADLATSTYTPVVNPDYNTQGNTVNPFPTVYGYNEGRLAATDAVTQSFDYGYFSPSTLTDNLVRGRGYTGNIDASSLVDLVGTLNTGTVAVGALSRGTQTNSGWHLLGNPYPAPLDWKKVRTGLPTGVIDAVYVYKSSDQYGGTYQFYQNGFGTLPNGIIGSMQGFFVRVSQTVNSFSFLNAWRSTTAENPTFNRPAADARPALQLDLVSAQGTHDPAYVYFEEGATAGIDDHFDAEKLPNTTGLNLASVAAGKGLAVNGLPALAGSATVALTVGVPTTGTYTLQAASLLNLSATEVYLHDALTGQQLNLKQQPSYSFTASSTALITGRFSLSFGSLRPLAAASGLTAAGISVYPNPAHQQFAVVVPAVSGVAQLEADVLNVLGQVVRHQTAALPATGARFTVDATGLPAGVYTLRLHAGAATIAKRVILQ